MQELLAKQGTGLWKGIHMRLEQEKKGPDGRRYSAENHVISFDRVICIMMWMIEGCAIFPRSLRGTAR